MTDRPFRGATYLAGHPCDVGEMKALQGDAGFAALQGQVFAVKYFDGPFQLRKKTSLTPCIDFDLTDEPGYGSAGASAGIGRENFAVRWTGRLVAPGARTGGTGHAGQRRPRCSAR
jgi:hypothetical protein